MSIGDEVVMLHDPWRRGIGVIDDIARDGRLVVEWGEDEYTLHEASELELAEVWSRKMVDRLEDDCAA